MPTKRIKKQVKSPQAPQQHEQFNNKMVEDSADCIGRSQPLTPTYLSLNSYRDHGCHQSQGSMRWYGLDPSILNKSALTGFRQFAKSFSRTSQSCRQVHQEQVFVPAVHNQVTSIAESKVAGEDHHAKILSQEACRRVRIECEQNCHDSDVLLVTVTVHPFKLKFRTLAPRASRLRCWTTCAAATTL